MIDLAPKQMAIVKSILNQHIPHYKVAVFGSRVTGTTKPFSDLDLCVMGETPLSSGELIALEEAFSESDLPIKVDIVSWATLSESFRQHIQEDLLVL